MLAQLQALPAGSISAQIDWGDRQPEIDLGRDRFGRRPSRRARAWPACGGVECSAEAQARADPRRRYWCRTQVRRRISALRYRRIARDAHTWRKLRAARGNRVARALLTACV